MHLVLATQRPAGVVSPEIRANCSLRLCLRTTDESDSRDVLGSAIAAHLPVHRPGRAYLRVGAADPLPLQVARVAGRPSPRRSGPRVGRWEWPAAGAARSTAPGAGPTDLARIVEALALRAESDQGPAPAPPVAPAAARPADRRGSRGQAAARARGGGPWLAVGLVDRPDAQAQEVLGVDLARGGGWLAVGGPASGRTTFLRTVLAEAAAATTPDELHVHVLDHDGGALCREAAALPHTGTTVGADDALRAVRLVDRLAAEVSARRAAGRSTPRLLLLVDGAESLSAQLDEADPARGSAALLRLVREGGAAGLTCVLTADRAVPGGRLAATVGIRLVLPLPDRADYGVAGVPARAVPGHRPPGRALVGEAARECQLVVPRPLAVPAPRCATDPPSAALRIPELDADPELPLPRSGTARPLAAARAGGTRRRRGSRADRGPGPRRWAAGGRTTRQWTVGDARRPDRPPDHRRCARRPGGGSGRPQARHAEHRPGPDRGGRRRRLGRVEQHRLAGGPGVVTVDDHATAAETPVGAALGTALPPGSWRS